LVKLFLEKQRALHYSLGGATAMYFFAHRPNRNGTNWMRRYLSQFVSIAHLGILETVRQPVFLLIYTSGLLLTGLFPVLISFTLGQAGKVTRDSALALHFVLGLILGAFSACATLTHEMRRGTAAAILTKPVAREVFFLAKYAGIAAVMLAFSATMTLATFLSMRTVAPIYEFDWWGSGPLLVAVVVAYAWGGLVNFFKRTPFVSSTTGTLMLLVALAFALSWAHSPADGSAPVFDLRVAPAAALISMGILVLAAISVTLAIRLDVVPTLSLASFVFVGGLVSDYFFGRHATTSVAARFFYTAMPNWQHFWMADALSGAGVIPWSYVLHAACYAAAYLAGMLCLGLFSFRNLEVSM
jgi:hypothetical protein